MHAPLAAQLDRAVRAERQRALAWALATVVASAVAALHSGRALYFAAVVGGLFALWSVRQSAGLTLAARDVEQGTTRPRRAFVALLDDPNPRAWRPLLVVWDKAPPAGERPPKPASVWRCDDELDDLLCHAGFLVVPEAWLDTGPRRWSKPRWVLANAGIAAVHRRAWLGRLYVHTVLRRDRPGPPVRLTVPDPAGAPALGEELPLGGSLLRAVGWRVVLLAVVTVLSVLVSS